MVTTEIRLRKQDGFKLPKEGYAMNALLHFFSGKGKPEPKYAYDPEREKPVIRASICTGERVAGFRDRKTGTFHELMLIRGEEDIAAFCRRYRVEETDLKTVY